jgi:hypothetical protein
MAAQPPIHDDRRRGMLDPARLSSRAPAEIREPSAALSDSGRPPSPVPVPGLIAGPRLCHLPRPVDQTAAPRLSTFACLRSQSEPAIRRMRVEVHGRYAPILGSHDTADPDRFAAWVQELQTTKSEETLRSLLRALQRTVFTLADHEAIARSKVQRALDMLAPAAPRPAAGMPPGLANLPRHLWWKLFIEGAKHDKKQTENENAMRFDNDESPGYYAAMSRAFEDHVSRSDSHELDFSDYNAMHLAVTRNTLAVDRDGQFRQVPHRLSGPGITFPMTQTELPHFGALRELQASEMLGIDQALLDNLRKLDPVKGSKEEAIRVSDQSHERGIPLLTSDVGGDMLLKQLLGHIYRGQTSSEGFSSTLAIHEAKKSGEPVSQLKITTNREASESEAAVNRLFKVYYARIEQVNTRQDSDFTERQQTLFHIARLVRALHVGHYFEDANGRLNTMVLLNRLLIDRGFSPVMMHRTDIFGGAYSGRELVTEIENGLRTFADEVDKAHGSVPDKQGGTPVGAVGDGANDSRADPPKYLSPL